MLAALTHSSIGAPRRSKLTRRLAALEFVQLCLLPLPEVVSPTTSLAMDDPFSPPELNVNIFCTQTESKSQVPALDINIF